MFASVQIWLALQFILATVLQCRKRLVTSSYTAALAIIRTSWLLILPADTNALIHGTAPKNCFGMSAAHNQVRSFS